MLGGKKARKKNTTQQHAQRLSINWEEYALYQTGFNNGTWSTESKGQNQGKIQLLAKMLALQWLLFTYILLQLQKQSEESKNVAYLLLIFLKKI